MSSQYTICLAKYHHYECDHQEMEQHQRFNFLIKITVNDSVWNCQPAYKSPFIFFQIYESLVYILHNVMYKQSFNLSTCRHPIYLHQTKLLIFSNYFSI